MTLSKALLATGLATVLVGVAPSAFAQHRGGGGERNRGASVSRGAANRGGGFSRGESRAASARSYSGPRGIYAGRASIAPRGFSGVRGRYYVPGGGRYSSFAPVRFYRPYYTFRPRLSLGFGLWAGYPLAYSSAYYDPFYEPSGYSSYGYPAYTYPPSSNYPRSTYPPLNYPPSAYPADPQRSQGSVAVQSRQSNNMGGLSFEITPSTAELFVDGAPVGTVGDFTSTTQPLGLPAGRHDIEVRAPGYRTMTLDVNIIAGQVIPYQGTLER